MRKSRDLILLDPPEIPIGDVAAVRAILLAAAKAGKAMSYAGVLDALGHRFTRPKMRALCRTLDAVDTRAVAAGEPELAVLVVREADRLPGQGWWVGKVRALGYAGSWTGDEAQAFVRKQQKIVFDYWRRKKRKKAKPTTGGSGRSTSRPRAARRA
ncbi:MAG TPA: hypothetical protein VHA35_22425 [Dongiaceae bacterium]|jgi:hypothetical protein|nr:hypothetical protein [Dongiaceae bacterium]